MVKENSYTDIALRYTILQLIFLILGLLIVYVLPVFFIVIPLFPLFLISYILGCISVVNLVKGRKEPLTNKTRISIIINIIVLVSLSVLAIYTIQNQTIF